MGRPSNRQERRAQILKGFSRVLANHGYAGATITAIADEVELAPGLIHHHFKDKEDLLSSLLKDLITDFRQRTKAEQSEQDDWLSAYVDGALKLDERSDLVAARCWVGVFAEAIRNPSLLRQMRRLIDKELESIQTHSRNKLDAQQAGAVLAFIIGSLVLGAFAPKKTRGFAAPGIKKLIASMRS